uniref:Uncharacterized protein n=1 Tax=Myoviridae sp. ctbWL16 TaxID=2826668 RepID=A0A8S5MSP6_9CAUD|nr:MAG TPA: hypothetical protein [Myoviridae sp. ctbWL16]
MNMPHYLLSLPDLILTLASTYSATALCHVSLPPRICTTDRMPD